MAAPGPASQRPSRLPLHRGRPSTNRSSPGSPSSLSVSHAESSRTSTCSDAGQGNDGPVNGSRSAHKTTQVGPDRKSVRARHRDVAPPRQQRRDVTGGAGADVGRTWRDDGGVVDDPSSAAQPGNRPSCGMRMSVLRSAVRQCQQPCLSPTSPAKSSSSTSACDGRAVVVPPSGSYNAPACQSRPRDASSSSVHHAGASLVDSPQRQLRAPVASSRRLTKSPAAAAPPADRQRSRNNRNCNAPRFGRKLPASPASESDETISLKSTRFGPPAVQHLPTADDLRRQSDDRRRMSDVRRPTDIADGPEYRPQSVAALIAPGRRSYRAWRVPDLDDDCASTADSMWTITSVDCSSSSGTLTDSGDSAGESKTKAGRDRRRRERGQFDKFTVSSARLASSHAPPPLYLANANPAGHKTHTKPLNRHASRTISSSSSSESPSPPAENCSKDIQQIGNFGMSPHAFAAISNKHVITPPSPPPRKCTPSRDTPPRSRPLQAFVGDERAPLRSRSNIPSSPRRLPAVPATGVAKHASGQVAHSPPLAAVVGQDKQMVFAERSLVQAKMNSAAVELPNPPPYSNIQRRHTAAAAVKRAASLASVNSSVRSSVSHIPVTSSTKAVNEKHVACQSPQQRVSDSARAASKISFASRQPGNGTRPQSHAVDKDRVNVSSKLVDTPVGSMVAGAAVSRATAKPTTAAVKQTRASQCDAVDGMYDSRPAKIDRHVPTTPTRATKIRSPATVVTRPVYNDPTTVTKRPPPPPPSKLKRPGSVSGVMAAGDRRRVSVTGQSRPVSMDCSEVSPMSQQPVDACRKKSDSCTDVARVSTSTIEEASTAVTKPGRGVLNKNDHLTKSYDCITPRDSELRDSDMNSSRRHGSSTSLIDMQPRRLVKPYSAINRCSTFGHKMAAPKQTHSINTDCSAKTGTEHTSGCSGARPSLASHARASELSDLSEVDEFECDRPASAGVSDMISAGARNRDGGQESVVEGTESATPSSVQQKPSGCYKFRTEYSIFLTGDSTSATVQVTSTSEKSPSNQNFASASTKQDDDVESCGSSKTRPRGNCNCTTEALRYCAHKIESRRLVDSDKPANESCISAARPATLPADTSTVEGATATDATDRSLTRDSYVVTYESDNIVVLDREPVIDCLTPDVDVVSTHVRQLLTSPAADSSDDPAADAKQSEKHGGVFGEEACPQPNDGSVGLSAGEGGLSRTLPLSESGYDTWKSSQGSVAVVAATCVGSTCVVAPDVGGEQQTPLNDGTLRICGHSDRAESCDTPSVEPSYVCEEGAETRQPEGGGESPLLFGDAVNFCSESVAYGVLYDDTTITTMMTQQVAFGVVRHRGSRDRGFDSWLRCG